MNVTDTDLVSFVHGELDPDRAAQVRQALANDTDLRTRHRAFVNVDAALAEALDTPPRRVSARRWQAPALAIAALLVVALVLVLQRHDGAASARNDFVELRVAPHGGGEHPLFTEVRFDLYWQDRLRDDRWTGCTVVPFPAGKDPEQVREELLATSTWGLGKLTRSTVPVVVTAKLHAPDGSVREGRMAPSGPNRAIWPIAAMSGAQSVALEDFAFAGPAPHGYYAGKPGPQAWEEDFQWMASRRSRRWLPDQVGEWRLELFVDSLPAPATDPWPTFAAPLRVETTVRLTGEVSAWSEPVDGMRARLVFAGGTEHPEHAPLALQIHNDSGRTRAYNVVGVTGAKIPQPLHLTLVVDGEDWTQRDDLAVMIPAGELMVPHADDAIRTLVVKADYWRLGDKRLQALTGQHRVQLRLHFEPLTWRNGDQELWQGKLQSPAIVVDLPAQR